MTWLLSRARAIASGAILLGVVQALGQVDFNNILFQLLTSFFTLLVSLLLGDTSALENGSGGAFA